MGDTLSTTTGIMSQGIDILDKIGLLEKVRNKLVNNPDVAATKLAGVLVALKRTYQIMDDTLVEFNSISFENPDARHDAKQLLNMARGGRLENALMEARAHCDNIWGVYNRYLRGWFSAVLNQQEQAEIHALFETLGGSDITWIGMLDTVAHQLQDISDEMLSRLDADKYDDARAIQQGVEELPGATDTIG
jgi:hypothetical protein